MSAATLGYGGYALAEPRHLGRYLTSNEPEQATFDVLATTYGGWATLNTLALLRDRRVVKKKARKAVTA